VALTARSRPPLAWLSVFLLIAVAALKTILTKVIFLEVPYPVAYSLLSALVTSVLLLLGFALFPRVTGPLQPLRLRMAPRLLAVCLAVAVDLGLSNRAIYLLPLALQQAIASTIPAVTMVIETVYRWRLKPLNVYLVVAALCAGAFLAHTGALPPLGPATVRRQLGEACMLMAVLAAGFKYVFAKASVDSYRSELGAAPLFLWIEVCVMTIMLPWAAFNGELVAILQGEYECGHSLFCAAFFSRRPHLSAGTRGGGGLCSAPPLRWAASDSSAKCW